MATKHPVGFWTVSLLMVALLALPVALEAQGEGTIVGQVIGPAGNGVQGARVGIAGTNVSAVTNEQGMYRIGPVPAGEHSLSVVFVGFVTANLDVQVEAGATITQDVVLEVFGEEITVRSSPLLQGQAKALNRQKNAVNITNVVAADQIGRFPDKNAAEAVQRVPAVTLLRDQGEGRYVLVRGTEPRLNSTTINGERIPSPEAGVRDIALDVIPADLLESIQVSKALTPDMDGDAIGGTVDLVTKRAPEQMRVSANLAGGYNEIVENNIVDGNFTFGNRFNEAKTGFIVSASAYQTDKGSDNFEPEYDDGYLDELQLRDYTTKRERYGATFALDQRLSDKSEVFLRGVWNNYKDTEVRRAFGQEVGNEALVRETKDRLQESVITSLTGGGHHSVGNNFVIDYRLAWNRAEEETPDQVTSVFEQEDVLFAPNVTPGHIDPNNIQANPLNEDLAEYVFDEIEAEYKFSEEEDLVGAFDVSQGFFRDSGFSGLWKAGAKIRLKDKVQDVNVMAFESDDDLLLTSFLSTWQSETPFLGGRYDIGPFQSPGAMRDLLASGTLEGERILEEDLADFDSSEDTLAAYGMVDLSVGKNTTLLAGVRVENTETAYNAYELAFDEEGDPTDLTPVDGGNDYTQWLPMVHLRQLLGQGSILRAAITRTLARPNFEQLAPFQLTNFEDEEIARGNPDLEVTTAWNFDLLYEYYLEPMGIVSAGLFYKRLEDNIYIATFDEDFLGTEFEVEMPVNGERATIQGLEMAFQNRFSKLPSPWDGFGLYFNYTFADSDASYTFREDTRLQGQARNVGNLALSYEKYGFTGRVSANYHGEYILEVGEEAAEDIWIDTHLQIDFSARQQITDRWSVFMTLVNLTDEPYRVYEGTPDRPRQEEYYGWWGTLGVRFDF